MTCTLWEGRFGSAPKSTGAGVVVLWRAPLLANSHLIKSGLTVVGVGVDAVLADVTAMMIVASADGNALLRSRLVPGEALEAGNASGCEITGVAFLIIIFFGNADTVLKESAAAYCEGAMLVFLTGLVVEELTVAGHIPLALGARLGFTVSVDAIFIDSAAISALTAIFEIGLEIASGTIGGNALVVVADVAAGTVSATDAALRPAAIGG